MMPEGPKPNMTFSFEPVLHLSDKEREAKSKELASKHTKNTIRDMIYSTEKALRLLPFANGFIDDNTLRLQVRNVSALRDIQLGAFRMKGE